MRYIPELQSLCAREIAKQCREMDFQTRYYFLKNIPEHLQTLIKAFPINFIIWCGDEQLLWDKILKYYREHKESQKYITDSYRKDCVSGITRRRVIWRKCSKIYCDNFVLQKIIAEPDNIFWGLCEECEEYRLPHYILKKLHLEIERRWIF